MTEENLQTQQQTTKGTRKRRWRIAIACLLLLLILPVITVLGISTHVMRQAAPYVVASVQDLPEDVAFDAAIVLGAKIYASGQLSARLQDRVDQGINVLKAGKTVPILLSGDGRSPNYDEVAAMQRYCLTKGVDKDVIWADKNGLNTYQSMRNARNVYGLGRLVVVTQQDHLYRAVYLARALGIEAYGVSANPRPYMDQQWQNVRETLARVKAFFNAQGWGVGD